MQAAKSLVGGDEEAIMAEARLIRAQQQDQQQPQDQQQQEASEQGQQPRGAKEPQPRAVPTDVPDLQRSTILEAAAILAEDDEEIDTDSISDTSQNTHQVTGLSG